MAIKWTTARAARGTDGPAVISLVFEDRTQGRFSPGELLVLSASYQVMQENFDAWCRVSVWYKDEAGQEMSAEMFDPPMRIPYVDCTPIDPDNPVARRTGFYLSKCYLPDTPHSFKVTARLYADAETADAFYQTFVIVSRAPSAAWCTGLLGGTGEMPSTLEEQLNLDPKGGYPCEGYGQAKLQLGHWWSPPPGQEPAPPWYATEMRPGFYDAWDPYGDALIEVRIQSAYPDLRVGWWFDFMVGIPPWNLRDTIWIRLTFHDFGRGSSAIAGGDPDNPRGSYDWEVFCPVFRWVDKNGQPDGSWRRLDDDVIPEGDFQCRFPVRGVPVGRSNVWRLEIAQAIPYRLDDYLALVERMKGLETGWRANPLEYGRGVWEQIQPDYGLAVLEQIQFDSNIDPDDPPPDGGLDNLAGVTGSPRNRIVPIMFFKKDNDGNPDRGLKINMITCVHLEPVANWMIEAMIKEIVSDPETYLSRASYLFLPSTNPDGLKWGIVEVSPSNGQDTNAWWEQKARTSKEAWAVRYLVKTFLRRGYRFNALLNLHNDVCPRYKQGGFPTVRGLWQATDDNAKEIVRQFIDEVLRPKQKLSGKHTVRKFGTGTGTGWEPDGAIALTAAYDPNRPFKESPGLGFRWEVLMEYDEVARYTDEMGGGYLFFHLDEETVSGLGRTLLEALHEVSGENR